MKTASLECKISVKDEIKHCISFIQQTWVTNDLNNISTSNAALIVNNLFNIVGTCEMHLFLDNGLKQAIDNEVLNRYKELKPDLVTFLLKDYDGYYQLGKKLSSGITKALSNLNGNLQEKYGFSAEDEIEHRTTVWEDLSLTASENLTDITFNGHYFEHANSPSFQDAISYDSIVISSIDVDCDLRILVQSLIKHAQLVYSHNNAVSIISDFKAFYSPFFTHYPDQQSLSKRLALLCMDENTEVKRLSNETNKPVIKYLKDLSLKNGPAISGNRNMNDIVQYMPYMPKLY